MSGTDPQPRIIPPARVSRRDGRVLLIWDAPAQWLTGDDELLALVGLLDGTRTVAEITDELAGNGGRPATVLHAEIAAVLAALATRRLLGADTTVEPEEPRLANITYNLTNRCNLRCPWCYNAGRGTAEAPAEVVLGAVHAARDLLTDDFTFNILGGEPTLDPARLLTCLELSTGLSRQPVQVSTNGTRLDAALARELARYDVEVQVSLDAPDRAGHDAIRGAGVYDRALAGVAELRSAGVPVILSMVFGHGGERAFLPYLELARSLGVRAARFIPLRHTGPAPDLSLPLPDLLSAWRELRRITVERPELAALLGRDFFSILRETCATPGCRTGCGLGRRVLLIDADGGIYPCPNLARPEFHCGNVATDTIAAAFLDSPVMNNLRRECRVSERGGCRGCAVRHWCAGDCRAEALNCGGGLDSPAPHCAELKMLIEEMLWAW